MNIQFNPNTMTGQLFSGYEAEGLVAGQHTLFVAGDVEFADIKHKFSEQLETDNKFTHIYFGASGTRWYDYYVVKKVLDHLDVIDPKKLIAVTLEIETFPENGMLNNSRVYWMLPIMWGGQTVSPVSCLGNSSVLVPQMLQLLTLQRFKDAPWKARLNLKWDYGTYCVVTPFKSCTVSTSESYAEDRLIANFMKDGTTHTAHTAHTADTAATVPAQRT